MINIKKIDFLMQKKLNFSTEKLCIVQLFVKCLTIQNQVIIKGTRVLSKLFKIFSY